eukprot:COSAG01_NODE_13260_length_1609_cov_1.115079_2_plen_228_part_00
MSKPNELLQLDYMYFYRHLTGEPVVEDEDGVSKASVQKYNRSLSGRCYHGVLNAIDCFSRVGYSVAIPGILNSQKAWNAFLKIREQAQRRYPALDIKKVQTDKRKKRKGGKMTQNGEKLEKERRTLGSITDVRTKRQKEEAGVYTCRTKRDTRRRKFPTSCTNPTEFFSIPTMAGGGAATPRLDGAAAQDKGQGGGTPEPGWRCAAGRYDGRGCRGGGGGGGGCGGR